jgi:hypothetical protein
MADVKEIAPLEKGDNAALRLRMGEIGQTGIITLGGQVGLETDRWELQWPYCINTYTKMANDPVIAPALYLVKMMIARAKWKVKVPRRASPQQKQRANYLKQVMGDMDHSWFSFVRDAASFDTYGFSVHEIVLRPRRKRYGSKYDDGLVGVQKLPTRAQETISKFNYDKDFRELESIEQAYYTNNDSSGLPTSAVTNATKTIPRYKFLLFKNASRKESPLGQSPLMAAWPAWKYMTSVKEFEAISIATDSRGLKVLYIPPEYMTEDASESQKEIYSYYQQVMNGLHRSEQSGIILPNAYDSDSREAMFKLELLGVQGQKTVDPDIVISRYAKEILTCLFADSLHLGQGSGGSNALAVTKSSLVGMYVESKLMEIKDQLNHHLVRLLWEQNGWDLTDVPEIEYDGLQEADLDTFSKFIQRIGAVGYLPKTVEVVNEILDEMGLDPYPEDTPIEDLNLPEDVSGSGEGLSEGLPSGTGKATKGGDKSTTNKANS